MSASDLLTLRVLIVDDEQDHLNNLVRMLGERVRFGGRTPGFKGDEQVEFSTCGSPEALSSFIDRIDSGEPVGYDLIISDVVMPLQTGGPLSVEGGALRLYRSLGKAFLSRPKLAEQVMLVITTAQNDIAAVVREEVVEDQRSQAVPWAVFLPKPASVSAGTPGTEHHEDESWTYLIGTAIYRYRDMRWRRSFVKNTWYELPAISTEIQRALMHVGEYAAQRVVLLIGETGTGKERLAERLHELSGRGGILVKENCCTLPDDHIESFMFGHERNPVKGYPAVRKGVFARTRKNGCDGTVFIDDFEHIPSRMSKISELLHQFIKDGIYHTVGGTTNLVYSGGIVFGVSSTDDLSVLDGRLRAFFGRIAQFSIRIPPLRERRADIIPLAQAMIGRNFGSPSNRELSHEAQQFLLEHDWPDNERELEDLFEWLAVTHSRRVIEAQDIRKFFGRFGDCPECRQESVDDPVEELPQVGNEVNDTKTGFESLQQKRRAEVSALAANGENHTVEFKETLEWDIRLGKQNKDVLDSALKELCAFLNADGGTLLIGISDDGLMKGLALDFKLCGKSQNKDGLERKLRDLIDSRFTPVPFGKVEIDFVLFPDGEVCQITIRQSSQVVHFDKQVYVRDGNRTKRMEGPDLTNWLQGRH
ncbi:MAG: sigma 54-interacting transcriptional regulator [Armatimonadetes bacterium]|nr:sigma 54-interacting transcriptional regulator [Armatimonadota bacterium]